ncbi:DUF4307 domain-containing protein [Ornithinimicrobium sp. Y1847]|uniref:DUF4307 domain-containing protein n=1 Tax=unclassified Ornithinimicrobium TaxID=2615080 RepID=UPI003B678E92
MPAEVDEDPLQVDEEAEEASRGAWQGPRESSAQTRRRWWIIGAASVAVMVAMAVWFGIAASAGRVHWVNTGQQVVSEEAVDVRFDLRRDASRAVVCELEAEDYQHSVVGRVRVEVGPSESSPSRHVEQVRTASPAVTGYVDRCWYADEDPPARD